MSPEGQIVALVILFILCASMFEGILRVIFGKLLPKKGGGKK